MTLVPVRSLYSESLLTRPGRVNGFLTRIFGLESALVNRACLPWGVSVLVVAGKPAVARPGSAHGRVTEVLPE